MNRFANALLFGLFGFNAWGAQSKFEGSLATYLGPSHLSLTPLQSDQRFPNIAISTKGTLIATWGAGKVRAKRSEDGGQTWSNEILIADPGFHGGGTTVDESTGDILVFAESKHPPAPLTIYRSQDDGITWSAEKPQIHPDILGHQPSMHMNEHGITLRHGPHRGRLIRASRYYGKKNSREEWPTHYTNAIYSDDGGRTWHTSAPFPENGTGEAAIIERADGSLYYNSRVHWHERPNNIRRRDAQSRDGGQTWTDHRIVEALPDGPQDTNYGCMGGLARLNIADQDILIYSNCDSPSGRHHGTVWVSFDGGRQWPIKRLLFAGKFAYSSLIAGRPNTPTEGKIFLHFEGGNEGASTVAVFNLSWILQGTPTGDGSVPELAFR